MKTRHVRHAIEFAGYSTATVFLLGGALQDQAARLGFVDTSGAIASLVGFTLLGASIVVVLLQDSGRGNRVTRSVRVASGVSAILLIVLSAGCSGTPTLPSSTVTSLAISGSAPSIGASSQYAATVVLAGSSDVENVTDVVTWQVANTAVATVSKAGLVTGVTAGSTTLTASYNGTIASAQLTIP